MKQHIEMLLTTHSLDIHTKTVNRTPLVGLNIQRDDAADKTITALTITPAQARAIAQTLLDVAAAAEKGR